VSNSGSSATTTLLTFTKPVEGQEEKFDEWYETIHVPQILQLPMVASAQRFKIRAIGLDEADRGEVSVGGSQVSHGWLAIYEVTGDPKVAVKTMIEKCADGTVYLDPSFDAEATVTLMAVPRSERKTEADVTVPENVPYFPES
jgi:hypothetical protein